MNLKLTTRDLSLFKITRAKSTTLMLFKITRAGNKRSYIPSLPPLTRCSQDTRFTKLWQKASSPCTCTAAPSPLIISSRVDEDSVPFYNSPRPSTSRGTQRLYVRLNTLVYFLSVVNSIDKSLSFVSLPSFRNSGDIDPSPRSTTSCCGVALSRFDIARSMIQSAIQHVSEVVAYRLIFSDSSLNFYDGLYMQSVAEANIHPSLYTLKQNLTLLVTVVTDRAQALAVREVMKASFKAFLMVLLAGGSGRAFSQADYEMVAEDFGKLKKVFCTCGEGLVVEEVVDREAEVVEGIVALMGMESEMLIEDFTTVACEAASGMGGMGMGMGLTGKVPMPPTTGRWNRSDPNTVLRVLCHRNDAVASWFLKRTFQLPKRR